MTLPSISFLLVLVLAFAPARANNQVFNPDFDTVIDPNAWNSFADAAVWDSLDVDSSPSSGSARVRETTQGQTGRLEQAISVSGGTHYEFAGCGHIPSGQTAMGFFDIGVNWYADACPSQVTFLGFDTLGTIAGPFDSWECRDDLLVAPADAQCGIVTLFMRNNAGTGTFEVHFDAIFLPEPSGSVSLLAGVVLLLLARRRALPRTPVGGFTTPRRLNQNAA